MTFFPINICHLKINSRRTGHHVYIVIIHFLHLGVIYRVSGTFRAQDPTIEHRMIRINPMRSGPDTIIRILRSCMEQVEEN